MELNRETVINQMQEWSDGICKNACLKGEYLNGKIVACETCFPNTVRNALALIKELTEEVADWKAIAEQYQKQFEDCAEDRAKLTEENERLRCEVADLQDELKCEKETNEHLCGEYMSAKADTVRKMQERLTKKFDRMHKSNFITVEVRQWIIDQIAKEMLEDINEQ